MKKSLVLLLGAVAITAAVIIFVFHSGPEPLEPSPFCGTVTDRVSLAYLDKEGLQDGVLNLIITNHSQDEFVYGDKFVVEVWDDGAWYSLPYVTDGRFPEPGYVMPPLSSGPMGFCVSTMYGELAPGWYRLIGADLRNCAPNAELFHPENQFFVFEFTV